MEYYSLFSVVTVSGKIGMGLIGYEARNHEEAVKKLDSGFKGLENKICFKNDDFKGLNFWIEIDRVPLESPNDFNGFVRKLGCFYLS
jgi:hypothetical protein